MKNILRKNLMLDYSYNEDLLRSFEVLLDKKVHLYFQNLSLNTNYIKGGVNTNYDIYNLMGIMFSEESKSEYNVNANRNMPLYLFLNDEENEDFLFECSSYSNDMKFSVFFDVESKKFSGILKNDQFRIEIIAKYNDDNNGIEHFSIDGISNTDALKKIQTFTKSIEKSEIFYTLLEKMLFDSSSVKDNVLNEFVCNYKNKQDLLFLLLPNFEKKIQDKLLACMIRNNIVIKKENIQSLITKIENIQNKFDNNILPATLISGITSFKEDFNNTKNGFNFLDKIFLKEDLERELLSDNNKVKKIKTKV